MKIEWIKIFSAVCAVIVFGISSVTTAAIQENKQLKTEIKQLETKYKKLIEENNKHHIISKAYTTYDMTKQEEIYKNCWKQE